MDSPHSSPLQHPAVSSVLNSTSSPVATQRRSSKVSVLPNAQQLPHDDWSRTFEITVHFDHCVRESKSVGRAMADSIVSFFSGSAT